MFELISKVFNSLEFWKIAIPSLIAIVIALVSHQLAVSRQIREQRKKQKIEYLIEAFSSLMSFSNNPNKQEAAVHLRSAAMKIQFMGSKSQDKQMKELIDSLIKKNDFNFDPLLCSLRDELRSELTLEKLEGNVYWVH